MAHVNHVGESLVLALGAAVSPIPLTISVLLLSQPDRGRAKAIAFAAGQVLALAILVTAAALLLRTTLGTTHHHNKTEATIDTVLGVVLLLAAARTFLTKPKPKEKKPSPQKQRSLAAEVFAGAGLMAVNVETLALVLAAVKELSLAKVGPLPEALTLIAITLITTLTATVPPLIAMLFPTRSGHALAWLNEQTTRHGRAIKGVFLFLFGAYLLYKGLQG